MCHYPTNRTTASGRSPTQPNTASSSIRSSHKSQQTNLPLSSPSHHNQALLQSDCSSAHHITIRPTSKVIVHQRPTYWHDRRLPSHKTPTDRRRGMGLVYDRLARRTCQRKMQRAKGEERNLLINRLVRICRPIFLSLPINIEPKVFTKDVRSPMINPPSRIHAPAPPVPVVVFGPSALLKSLAFTQIIQNRGIKLSLFFAGDASRFLQQMQRRPSRLPQEGNEHIILLGGCVVISCTQSFPSPAHFVMGVSQTTPLLMEAPPVLPS